MRKENYKPKANKFIDSTQEILKSYQVNICKRNRIKLTSEQLTALELCFWEDNHPNTQTKENLAYALNIPLKNLQIWFQNRRAKRKSEKDAIKIKYEKKMLLEEQTWYEKVRKGYENNRYHSVYDEYYNKQYYPQETNNNIYYQNVEMHPESYQDFCNKPKYSEDEDEYNQ
ncbi:hypothetical protein BDAP_001387 [Binucleata daphniae]